MLLAAAGFCQQELRGVHVCVRACVQLAGVLWQGMQARVQHAGCREKAACGVVLSTDCHVDCAACSSCTATEAGAFHVMQCASHTGLRV